MTKTEQILQLLYKPDHESKQAAIAMIDELVKDSERLDFVVDLSSTSREAIDKARGE